MGYHIGLFKLIIIVPNVLIFCLGCIMVGISTDVIKNKAGKFDEIKDENILPDGVTSSAALGLTAGIFLGLVSFLFYIFIIKFLIVVRYLHITIEYINLN